MSKDIYGTPVLREFENNTFYFPEKMDQYLTILYGNNYMDIPPVEKRRKGHNIYIISED
jgi:lipopolysaccharide cholinephosphotransferase